MMTGTKKTSCGPPFNYITCNFTSIEYLCPSSPNLKNQQRDNVELMVEPSTPSKMCLLFNTCLSMNGLQLTDVVLSSHTLHCEYNQTLSSKTHVHICSALNGKLFFALLTTPEKRQTLIIPTASLNTPRAHCAPNRTIVYWLHSRGSSVFVQFISPFPFWFNWGYNNRPSWRMYDYCYMCWVWAELYFSFQLFLIWTVKIARLDCWGPSLGMARVFFFPFLSSYITALAYE